MLVDKTENIKKKHIHGTLFMPLCGEMVGVVAHSLSVINNCWKDKKKQRKKKLTCCVFCRSSCSHLSSSSLVLLSLWWWWWRRRCHHQTCGDWCWIIVDIDCVACTNTHIIQTGGETGESWTSSFLQRHEMWFDGVTTEKDEYSEVDEGMKWKGGWKNHTNNILWADLLLHLFLIIPKNKIK